MPLKKSITVIIPVYNAEATLQDISARAHSVLNDLTDSFELIFVNDGSQDQSWEQIQKIGAQSKHVRGINLMRNYGQHNALLCGIREARYDLTVTLDDDLQTPPEEIPKLISKLNEGYDVVYGIPEKTRHSPWRAATSKIIKSGLSGILNVKIAEMIGPFRIFKTNLRKHFVHHRSPYVNIDVLLSWGARNYGGIQVEHAERAHGKSGYNLLKLIRHTVNMVTGYSSLPLKIASMVGFAFMIFGGFIITYVLARYLISGVAIPGFAFLASIISIYSGAQLFALGIIGEYLSRMYFCIMDKPAYTIGETFNEPKNPQENT